jgi:signal transduction histidine kinase
MTGVVLGDDFARETGELTIWRWKVGLSLYLFFASIGAVVEWRVYPDRGVLLAAMLGIEVIIVAVTWLATRGPIMHPKSAWAVMLSSLAVCLVVALYNAAVDGDMLYVLLTYLGFMLASAMIIPWGAGFQLALNCGIIVAYVAGITGGARVGPVPGYDYITILAGVVLSTFGAYYIDQYRRQLFAQAGALREANRNLEAASRARTELLSGLSHDMRTPLSVLMGYAEILNDEPGLSEELRQPLRSIGREAQELLYLVDSVLDLARLESGRLPFHRSTFVLADLLEPLRETTQDLLRDRHVRLRWEVPDNLTIDSDEGKVREIVRNLLSNAVKYTEEGEISVSTASRDHGVEIVVADTGIGIAPENLHAIFDPFHQVLAGNGPRQVGSGFGLYMVKLLVALVGGRIDVHSVPYGGSTFRVWLPPEPPQSVLIAKPEAPPVAG